MDYTLGMNSTSASWQRHLDETKRGLARLLARENLTVRHANVPTANFDLQSRTLTLPLWKNITVDQYDLLIGHEVGHALYSDDIEAVKTSHQFPGLHTYINVLEDVRIERRVQEEFPGLRGSFTRGYRDFFNHGPIFQLEQPIEQYDFIDRINIHYKIGAHVSVPFSDAERLVLARIDKCRTMQEVVALARELWNGQKKQNEEKQQQEQQPAQSQSGEDAESESAPSASQSSESDESDESSESSESNASESNDDEQESASAGGEQDQDADEPNASAGDPSVPSSTDPVAKTDQSNAEALSQMEQDNASDVPDQVSLSPLPASVVKELTIDNPTFVSDVLKHLGTHHSRMDCAQSYLAEFSRKYASTVQHMAREFDRRKTAKLHERARSSRTGRINMTKLASYKFREDIFQQVTVLPNGKSHGIVLLVDGSGSMSKVFGDVIDQVMLFTQFAEKVNIPVQAFVFQSHRSYQHPNLDAMPEYVAKPNGCELVCIYDSTVTDRKSQQLALAATAAAFNGYVPAGSVYGYCPINRVGIVLGMTPLESGLLLVERHVANLKSRLRLEKLSLFVLTDGDDTGGITYAQPPSSASSYYRPNVAIYRDTVTRTTYADFDMREGYGRTAYYERQTGVGAMLVDSIRRRHDARVVRIHLVAKREMKGLSDPQAASYMLKSSLRPKVNDEGYTVSELGKSLDGFKTASQTGTVTYSSPVCYYDALVVVSTDKLDLDEDDFDSKNTTGWTARKITSAFVKSNVNATKNRVFVNTVVPYLA